MFCRLNIWWNEEKAVFLRAEGHFALKWEYDCLPHIFITKDIAQVTDQKIEYTKHKGLDDKKCEALLLDSLKDHGSLTKPEIVRLLWDVLPDQLDDKQKNNKLDYLLKKLRMSGKVYAKRAKGISVWYLTENM